VKTYTVIGFWMSSEEAYAEHIEAEGPRAAVLAVAKAQGFPSDLILLGAVEGEHAFHVAADHWPTDGHGVCAGDLGEYGE
jgi:hypothetical protein